MTESEVLLLFEKYSVVDVKVSTFQNRSRVAHVQVRAPDSGLEAVAALNGRRVSGHVLHVEDVDGRMSAQRPRLEWQPAGACTELVPPLDSRTVHPTRFGSKQSMDVLLAEMKRRHPNVGYQSVLDLVVELHLQHGVFGVPLTTLGQVISERLSGP